jgi:site-specific DNA-methyltransferase (adenine-specific)
MEVMKQFDDNSVDLILNDPPFGCTGNKWDTVLPLDEMWAEYKRILKPQGLVVLFACSDSSDQPFLGRLMMSNAKDFKYTLVFPKPNHSNPLHAKTRPLRKHEDILVFFEKQGTYNPLIFEKHIT